MSLIADEDPTIDYTERYDVYMSNLPAGASYRNIVHYAQLINLPYEEFLRWDYESKEENIKVYGQPTPPAYDLSLLDFPLAVLYGQ
jgi:lysosomal acid lipase/cholesteryl ester hydrolase